MRSALAPYCSRLSLAICSLRWAISAAVALLLAGLLLASGGAFAQTYPTKPVNLMVPYPAGGLSDIIARKINVPLAAELKQPVIIENLGGAGGAIGMAKMLTAPADGRVLGQSTVVIDSAPPQARYLFPLVGRLYVQAGPSPHTHHRWAPPEAFAYDIVSLADGHRIDIFGGPVS